MCTFQVFVAFIILPLSYGPVRFPDLTPLIFSHQSITPNPPIPLISSFELGPSFWGAQVPKTQHSHLGVVSPQSRAAENGGKEQQNLEFILNVFEFPFQK